MQIARTGRFYLALPSYGKYGMIEISKFKFFYKVRRAAC